MANDRYLYLADNPVAAERRRLAIDSSESTELSNVIKPIYVSLGDTVVTAFDPAKSVTSCHVRTDVVFDVCAKLVAPMGTSADDLVGLA